MSIVPLIACALVTVALGALGFMRPKRRSVAWLAAASAALTGLALGYDAFWPFIVLGLLTLVGVIACVDFIDLGFRLRLGLVAFACSLSFVALWPSLSTLSGGRVPCPAWLAERVKFRLVAGLDLRGGLRLVYNVDVDEAIRDKRDRHYEEMRAELTHLFGFHSGDELPSEEAYRKLGSKVTLMAPRENVDVIRVSFKERADADRIDARFLERFRGDLGYSLGGDGKTFEFRVKSAVRASIRESAVSQAREIILRRIDELGLREASVSTRNEDVIVEVPGEDEASFAHIRDIISQTARLEFKLLDDDEDFFGKLKTTLPESSLPEGLEFYGESVPVGLDSAGEVKTRQHTYAFLKKGPNETSKQTLLRFREWVSTLPVPPDREVGFELAYRTVDEISLKQEESGFRSYLLKSRAEVTGDLIRDTAAVSDQGRGGLGGWNVAITFNEQGGRLFERITAANVKRRFAIILDNRVESAPVIQGPIPGGHASITLGSSDPEAQLRDAKKLELVLRSGALPAPIIPSNEQRIGPTLGRDAIKRAVQAAVAGSLLVLTFMLVYYRRGGLIADVVVLMNLVLQLAIMASFGASLTLPGICGLALTIGMSVDSNVLINERLREETRAGKRPRAAVETGFKRALNAIIDGHVTTLIAGIVLSQYGTGPVKGFATALLIGMTANVFTGVVVSRMLFDFWVRGFKLPRLDVG